MYVCLLPINDNLDTMDLLILESCADDVVTYSQAETNVTSVLKVFCSPIASFYAIFDEKNLLFHTHTHTQTILFFIALTHTMMNSSLLFPCCVCVVFCPKFSKHYYHTKSHRSSDNFSITKTLYKSTTYYLITTLNNSITIIVIKYITIIYG